MKIGILDAGTLGEDLSLDIFTSTWPCDIFKKTGNEELCERIAPYDAVIVNKIRLTEEVLSSAPKLKLICVAATGYDNIDVGYCKTHNIAVCNVKGYSSHSVAQLTVSAVLSMAMHLTEYTEYVRSGEYSKSGVANRLTPTYHELSGKTWGIIGYGNIGREVSGIAEAFGCRVVYTRKTPDHTPACLSLDELLRTSDIVTIHVPLTPDTRGLIGAHEFSVMKSDAILFNAARGAVIDEEAAAQTIENNGIGAFGTDVYSEEPFSEDHPLYRVRDRHNVLLTPHMAWGAYEARVRCLSEMVENIKAFESGKIRNRVDM